MDKTAKNPSGQTVLFNEEAHTYTIVETDQVLTSVTTFISKFFSKFDADAVAKKCVGKPKYKGMSEVQIKAVWDKEGLRGRTEGTNVHWYAECFFEGDFDKLPKPQSDRESKIFNQIPSAVLALEERFIYIGSEIIVFSSELGIAGMIDLLMFDKKSNDIIILDHKQNKIISTSNPWDNAFSPIDHLEASDIIKYTLQLSLYQKLLSKECYYKNVGFRKCIVHLQEDTVKFIPLKRNLMQEIDTMLEHS